MIYTREELLGFIERAKAMTYEERAAVLARLKLRKGPTSGRAKRLANCRGVDHREAPNDRVISLSDWKQRRKRN